MHGCFKLIYLVFFWLVCFSINFWIIGHFFQEPCETSRALEAFVGFHTKASGYIGPANPGYCDAASMLSKGWNKVSWNVSTTHL